jgi:ankyrin repeat protein
MLDVLVDDEAFLEHPFTVDMQFALLGEAINGSRPSTVPGGALAGPSAKHPSQPTVSNIPPTTPLPTISEEPLQPISSTSAAILSDASHPNQILESGPLSSDAMRSTHPPDTGHICSDDAVPVDSSLTIPEPNNVMQSPLSPRSMPANSISASATLRKRLPQGATKHTSSVLADVVSIMEHLTISTSSAASNAPTRWSKTTSSLDLPRSLNVSPLPAKRQYPILLPGAFSEYCWEQLNNGNLRRCNSGKYRKGSPVCIHKGRSLSRFSPEGVSSKYELYEDSKGAKVDIFGNSALHVAAALAAAPYFLIDWARSFGNVNAVNNGGETFLHLIQPQNRYFCDDGRNLIKSGFPDICDLLKLLKDLNFNFRQQDHQGRTTLHWLSRPEISPKTLSKVLETLSQTRTVLLPVMRDNLGYSLAEYVNQPKTSKPLHSSHQLADEHLLTQNYASATGIETIEDLEHFELHADLLRTINISQKNPQFEDWRGRNGLHCLAEVSFSLNLPKILGGRKQPDRLNCSVREVYLEALIEGGIDTNSYDKDGTTPLMAFIIHTRADGEETSINRILHRLFDAGADIHRRNRQGETALHIAVKLGRRVATQFLLDVGANVYARASEGHSILALGMHMYADRAKTSEFTYAQIMICTTLVRQKISQSGTVALNPTILEEWGLFFKGQAKPLSPPTMSTISRGSSQETLNRFERNTNYAPTSFSFTPSSPQLLIHNMNLANFGVPIDPTFNGRNSIFDVFEGQ